MKDNSFLILKTVVVIMGITLVLGVIFLSVIIYQRGDRVANNTDDIVSKLSRQITPGACSGGEINLPEKGIIDDYQIKDNMLVILFNTTDETERQKLIVYDYCNNAIISQFVTHK